MPSLYLIRGLPGSGKSTLAKALMHDGIAEVWCEADKYFEGMGLKFDPARLKDAHDYCQSMARDALMRGLSVVVSNTFTQRWEAQPYLDMAAEYGAPVEVIEAKGDFGSVHGVPESTIAKMRARWEEF